MVGEFGDHYLIVDDGLPESVLIVIVVERSRCLELLELFIGNWETLLAVEAFQIVAKGLRNAVYANRQRANLLENWLSILWIPQSRRLRWDSSVQLKDDKGNAYRGFRKADIGCS